MEPDDDKNEIVVNEKKVLGEQLSSETDEKKDDDETIDIPEQTPNIHEISKKDKEEDELGSQGSQVSEEPDGSTIINHNYDSAYDTNEVYSQNDSNLDSRVQSAETNDDDIDNETGENFQNEKEIFGTRSEIFNLETEKMEIKRLENELENPPTPDENDESDVVVNENPLEAGIDTSNDDHYHGKAMSNEEVHT